MPPKFLGHRYLSPYQAVLFFLNTPNIYISSTPRKSSGTMIRFRHSVPVGFARSYRLRVRFHKTVLEFIKSDPPAPDPPISPGGFPSSPPQVPLTVRTASRTQANLPPCSLPTSTRDTTQDSQVRDMREVRHMMELQSCDPSWSTTLPTPHLHCLPAWKLSSPCLAFWGSCCLHSRHN